MWRKIEHCKIFMINTRRKQCILNPLSGIPVKTVSPARFDNSRSPSSVCDGKQEQSSVTNSVVFVSFSKRKAISEDSQTG